MTLERIVTATPCARSKGYRRSRFKIERLWCGRWRSSVSRGNISSWCRFLSAVDPSREARHSRDSILFQRTTPNAAAPTSLHVGGSRTRTNEEQSAPEIDCNSRRLNEMW